MATKVIKPVKFIPAAIQPVFNFSFRTKCLIIAVIGFVFYANSIPNKYAFDDVLTITQNANVQMGFSGIPKILAQDLYSSYYANSGGDPTKRLSGGRYRPLSEITFAIEQGIFGNWEGLPYIRHLVNVIAYMVCLLAIFYFLAQFLLCKIPGGSDCAFLATILFAIHPLHTEVVANIKSLDEILSLLFIMLTFIYSLKYQSLVISHKSSVVSQKPSLITYLLSLISFFLALLSKEYAVTLVFFIPFLFYLLNDKKPLQAVIASIPYYGVFAVYLLLRYNAVGFHNNIQTSDLTINPYLYATPIQKLATEWFVLGKYLGLLFLPYPLSCDYSYSQIPYHKFQDITVILSILIYLSIFVWGIILTRKKNLLSFAVFFFLLNIFMISNFVLDIGATMGERLVFHSSLGLVIILSYYLFKVISGMKSQTKKKIIISVMSVIGITCFAETVTRNAQWKDDTSLWIHDVGVSSNSFLVNLNAGDMYFSKGELDSAGHCWDKVVKLYPNYPNIKPNFEILSKSYFAKGLESGMKNGKPHEGIMYMKKALLYDSTNSNIWYNLGGAYFSIQQYDSARYAWLKTLQYKPDSADAADAKRGLQALVKINL